MTSPRKSPASELLGLDMIGVAGAPEATLQALLGRFQEADLTGARLILLTDRQGERSVARYAALIDRPGGPRVLSAPAFGPHFGAGGTSALLELAGWAQHHDLPLRETVLGGPADQCGQFFGATGRRHEPGSPSARDIARPGRTRVRRPTDLLQFGEHRHGHLLCRMYLSRAVNPLL